MKRFILLACILSSVACASEASTDEETAASDVTSSKPVRDLGELSVVFRSAELVEGGGQLMVGDPGGVRPAQNFEPHMRNLANFIELGSSSLTKHETRTLARGLLVGESSSVASTFRVGDRVMITGGASKAPHRGIVAFIRSAKDIRVLVGDGASAEKCLTDRFGGAFFNRTACAAAFRVESTVSVPGSAVAPIVISKVLAAALQDGK